MERAFKRHVARKPTPSLERQEWLELVVEALRTKFIDAGYTVPRKIRVSIGWPKRAASCGAIGECWSTKASSDRHHELFISPQLTDSARIVDVLAHEMDHATVGTEAGHGKAFKQCALAIGLQGPMRATTATPEFTAWAETLFKRIGHYPAGYLVDSPKQGTRGIKCTCHVCGYTIRTTRKWLDAVGPVICPVDEVPFIVELAKVAHGAHRRVKLPEEAKNFIYGAYGSYRDAEGYVAIVRAKNFGENLGMLRGMGLEHGNRKGQILITSPQGKTVQTGYWMDHPEKSDPEYRQWKRWHEGKSEHAGAYYQAPFRKRLNAEAKRQATCYEPLREQFKRHEQDNSDDDEDRNTVIRSIRRRPDGSVAEILLEKIDDES